MTSTSEVLSTLLSPFFHKNGPGLGERNGTGGKDKYAARA